MSKLMSESGFTTEGFDNVPNLYNDRVHKKRLLTEMGTSALQSIADQYSAFLESSPMPHHEAQARHFLRHVQFELDWRDSRSIDK